MSYTLIPGVRSFLGRRNMAKPLMSADKFNSYLRRVRLTQTATSELFGVEDRTVRRWAAGTTPVPDAVAILLKLVARKFVSLDEVEYVAGRISLDELEARRDERAAEKRQRELYVRLKAQVEHKLRDTNTT
jgi:hypothetical protein